MRNIQEFSAYCQGDNWTPAVQQAIREKVDGIFSCYDEKVTVEKRYSLPENATEEE